ncbi:hypothetical protein BKA62DRAFT_696462 [Auriculariales sp. MPI-PUGE-AT-0066]|nr:hypothetical protein BKA62DRAFT_696462 [Auriculariales sp. MPI-PUGE-AT-0066]
MSRGARDPGATLGIGSLSMRENYAGGVSQYYAQVGATYRNPHFPGVKLVCYALLNAWWSNERNRLEGENDLSISVLDLACGAGEVTICLSEWEQAARAAAATSSPSHSHLPPSRQRLRAVAVPERFKLAPIATDPFTGPAFRDRTGLDCLNLSFEDIANNGLPGDETFEIVFISFALHLVPDSSGLFGLLWNLSTRARFLAVIGPHKKPEIRDGWGWMRWDPSAWQGVSSSESLRDTVLERVHLRVYRSLNVEC